MSGEGKEGVYNEGYRREVVKMETLRKAKEKVTGKATEGIFNMLEDMLGSIDAFDQIAALLKTVVPLKAEITVKGKKAVEVRALIKNGELWVGFRRLKQAKADEEATEEAEEVDTEN